MLKITNKAQPLSKIHIVPNETFSNKFHF